MSSCITDPNIALKQSKPIRSKPPREALLGNPGNFALNIFQRVLYLHILNKNGNIHPLSTVKPFFRAKQTENLFVTEYKTFFNHISGDISPHSNRRQTFIASFWLFYTHVYNHTDIDLLFKICKYKFLGYILKGNSKKKFIVSFERDSKNNI